MGNSTENTYKIYENRSKQKEDTGTWTDKKEKATSEKNNDTTTGNKRESTGD